MTKRARVTTTVAAVLPLALLACGREPVSSARPTPERTELATPASLDIVESTATTPDLSFEAPAIPFSDFDEPVLALSVAATPPVRLFAPSPQFPQGAKQIAGDVVLESILGTDGTIARIRIEKSLHPAYDQECVRAFKLWRLEPARLEGRAINVYLRLTVRFRLVKRGHS